MIKKITNVFEIIFFVILIIVWFGLLFIILNSLILNSWVKWIDIIEFNSNHIIIFIFLLIGILLIPFAKKLKIGFFEIERLEKKVEEVEVKEVYMGEVLKTNTNNLYFYDSEGLHKLPDNHTANFLKTRRGEILVDEIKIRNIQKSYEIDSVLNQNSRIYNWKGHIFIILNKKKYHIGSMGYLNDWGRDGEEKKEENQIDNDNLRLYPTGK